MQVNSYETNPIGCLQERMQKQGLALPVYTLSQAVGADHTKCFVMTVSLADGSRCEGAGPNKKAAKQTAARLMLDILDGRAKLVSEEVSQSIDLGLKALRECTNQPAQIEDPVQNRGRTDDEEDTTSPAVAVPFPAARGSGGASVGGARASSRHASHLPPPRIENNFTLPLDKWLANLLVDAAWQQINREPKPGEICKLCNLVFTSEVKCEEHKEGSRDHRAVTQGIYPGGTGFHCLLCWTNYLQPESLLNHIARPNHQARARAAGVLKIWMEPEPLVPTWDTLETYRRLRRLAEEEEEKDRRRGRSGSPPAGRRRSRSRSQTSGFGGTATLSNGTGGGRLGRGGSREPLKPDTDWREAQRRNWRQEEEQHDRAAREGHWDRGDRHRRPPPPPPYSGPGFGGRGRHEYYDGGERYGDLEEEEEYYFRESRRREGERSNYYTRYGAEEEGGGWRQAYHQRLPDLRHEAPGAARQEDLRDRLLKRRRSRESSGLTASSSHRHGSRSSSRSQHRSSSRSAEPSKKRKKDKKSKKKKKKKRQSRESSGSSSASEPDEVEEEVEDGELVEGTNKQEKSLKKVKSALISILDEEIFSIRATKK